MQTPPVAGLSSAVTRRSLCSLARQCWGHCCETRGLCCWEETASALPPGVCPAIWASLTERGPGAGKGSATRARGSGRGRARGAAGESGLLSRFLAAGRLPAHDSRKPHGRGSGSRRDSRLGFHRRSTREPLPHSTRYCALGLGPGPGLCRPRLVGGARPQACAPHPHFPSKGLNPHPGSREALGGCGQQLLSRVT